MLKIWKKKPLMILIFSMGIYSKQAGKQCSHCEKDHLKLFRALGIMLNGWVLFWGVLNSSRFYPSTFVMKKRPRLIDTEKIFIISHTKEGTNVRNLWKPKKTRIQTKNEQKLGISNLHKSKQKDWWVWRDFQTH